MLKAVIVLSKHTGMTEQQILDLPQSRIRNYLKAIKELNQPNE